MKKLITKQTGNSTWEARWVRIGTNGWPLWWFCIGVFVVWVFVMCWLVDTVKDFFNR